MFRLLEIRNKSDFVIRGTSPSHILGPNCLATMGQNIQRHEIDVQFYLRSVLGDLPALPPEELQSYPQDEWKCDLMAEQQASLNAHHASLVRRSVR